jgi:hypothetical protein
MTSGTTNFDNDLEFYCFLRLSLPSGYEIVSEPDRSYYSEWRFCYKVYRGNDLLETYVGDFRDLERGSLVRAAESLLQKLGISHADWKQAAARSR